MSVGDGSSVYCGLRDSCVLQGFDLLHGQVFFSFLYTAVSANKWRVARGDKQQKET